MDTRNKKNQRLVALFLLGCLLLNYPILSLFSTAQIIMGIPALYLYIFVAWLVLIGLTVVIVNRAP